MWRRLGTPPPSTRSDLAALLEKPCNSRIVIRWILDQGLLPSWARAKAEAADQLSQVQIAREEVKAARRAAKAQQERSGEQHPAASRHSAPAYRARNEGAATTLR
ncbi:hypothetical protein MN608_06363 [Microdochium nivale]|nr:hypothetical protein MN608_06363 [Microdochium nivale]